MGLLLGASVVTVFELLDVMIYGLFLNLFKGNQKKSKVYENGGHNTTQGPHMDSALERDGNWAFSQSGYFRDIRSQNTLEDFKSAHKYNPYM